MVPSMMMLRKVKKPVKMKAIPAWTKFLSFGRQLKMDSHPWGSGSDLPRMKFFADASFPPAPAFLVSFGLLAAVC